MGAVYLTGRDRHVWQKGEDLIAIKPNSSGATLAFIYHSIFGRFHKVSLQPYSTEVRIHTYNHISRNLILPHHHT
jgi:hypothetical protein